MATLPHASAQELGIDAERLQMAYRLLTEWTKGPQAPLPSAALLVGRRGRVVPPQFFGRQGPEADAGPIRRDGIFLLASITKPVTYLGAMILVERGLLGLTEPVTRYIPEFAAHHKEDILVQHLFTHTSGMPDMLANNVDLRRAHAPLEQFIRGAVRDTVPLFAAGTQFNYQSMGTLVVAEIIQRLSQLSIHEFLKKEIFAPLGLDSTALGSRGLDEQRLVSVKTPEYQSGGDFGWNSRYWRELGAPWGGMFSTPEELAIICQLMLSRGASQGVRILSTRTIELMTINRLEDYAELPEPIRRTRPWGLGWQLNPRGTEDSWSDLLDRNVCGHTGATGTLAWIDPQREGFCVLLTTTPRSQAPWRLTRVSNIVAAAFD